MNVKRILSWIYPILGIITFNNVLGKMDVYITSVECINYLPDIIKNVSCTLDRTSLKTGSMDLEFALAQDVRDIQGIYILTLKKGSYLSNFTEIKVDLCQVLASVETYFLLKMVTNEVRRIGNLPMECPYKMNTRYTVNGFTINSNLIPSYMPVMNFISDLHTFFRSRKAGRVIVRGRFARS